VMCRCRNRHWPRLNQCGTTGDKHGCASGIGKAEILPNRPEQRALFAWVDHATYEENASRSIVAD
jgi:hypothetical protein